MRVGIIGCGLIGQKRAKVLGEHCLIACADTTFTRAEALAQYHPGCIPYEDYRVLLARDDIDLVIVATPHAFLAQITGDAIDHHKHVLVEKPAACRLSEVETLIEKQSRSPSLVHVGFNHRYHPALQKAHALIAEGALGDLMYVRARYGHGGRLGYESEWRSRPEISGGGELIDQGVHLIDLARWFLGDFTDVQGSLHTYFWNAPVEDNVFMTLHTAERHTAFLHASTTEWKNLFSFEIYGKIGKLEITGLGGSYGTEKLTWYKMLPQMGPPEVQHWEYTTPDDSWNLEFQTFLADIQQGHASSPNLHDALAAMQVVERLYQKRIEIERNTLENKNPGFCT